jgi:hypothetical protein
MSKNRRKDLHNVPEDPEQGEGEERKGGTTRADGHLPRTGTPDPERGPDSITPLSHPN